MAATHFHDVFREDLLDPESVPIAFLHMQVMFTTEDGEIATGRPDTALSRPGTAAASGSGTSTSRPGTSTSRPGTSTSRPGTSAPARGDKITYLYRVAEGLSLNSHAAQCAEIFGLPAEICARAQYVSRLISTHELGQLLDEEMLEDEREELAEAEAVCRRFLAWNLTADDGVDVKDRKSVV